MTGEGIKGMVHSTQFVKHLDIGSGFILDIMQSMYVIKCNGWSIRIVCKT